LASLTTVIAKTNSTKAASTPPTPILRERRRA